MGHVLTIRLSDPVYCAARNMAESRGISIDRLVQEAIEESVSGDLSRAYALLAADSPAAEIESSFAIQAEALGSE